MTEPLTNDNRLPSNRELVEANYAHYEQQLASLRTQLAQAEQAVAQLTGDVGAKEWALANTQAQLQASEQQVTRLREILGKIPSQCKSDEDIPDNKEEAYHLGYQDALIDCKAALAPEAKQ